ncbi:MAG: hypothetical protein ACYTF0_01230 [Planctomycetota bacterium]|jgi:hypothetical protein
MRCSDAEHVDLRPLLARRPGLGLWYARAGWLAAALIMVQESWAPAVAAVAALLWFVAWYQAVGRLWRAPLLLALFLQTLRWAQQACLACQGTVEGVA